MLLKELAAFAAINQVEVRVSAVGRVFHVLLKGPGDDNIAREVECYSPDIEDAAQRAMQGWVTP